MNERTQRLTRRQMLGKTARAGAALAAPWVVPASVLGRDGAVAPSDRIILGGIGIGGRGQHDLGELIANPDVQFVAVCDVRMERRLAIKNMADVKYRNTECATYRHFPELLDRRDIDAVLIATGDRWHMRT